MEVTPSPFTVVTPKSGLRLLLVALVVVVFAGLITTSYFLQQNKPPKDFPVGQAITIEPGSSISAIVKLFTENGYVRSEFLLYAYLLTQYSPSDIKASTYVFDKAYPTTDIAKKLATGDFTSNLVRLTHKEGEPVRELATEVHSALPAISREEFITLATPLEGTLFPETYFFPPHYTAADVIATLSESYSEFMNSRRAQLSALALSESEVIILASIVEREANSIESMGFVSGILQNRLDIGMPLQADASLEYVLGKPLKELTPEDLKLDSPYNTYLNRGLPPTPIGNPGAMAIDAVLNPTPSDYLFYITGNDGEFYYATTYEDHKRNIARYLRS